MKTSLTLAFSLSLASLVGCSATAPSGPAPQPNDGTIWSFAATPTARAYGLRMMPNGTYFLGEAVVTGPGSADVSEEVGTYLIDGPGQATLTPSMDACGGAARPAYVITYAETADGTGLDVSTGTATYSDGHPVAESPYARFALTTGCFEASGFVPGSLTAVSN